jgi:hypothetical protein
VYVHHKAPDISDLLAGSHHFCIDRDQSANSLMAAITNVPSIPTPKLIIGFGTLAHAAFLTVFATLVM